MAKKWEELSQSEKITDLRNDVKTIFSNLNSQQEAVRNITLQLETVANLLNEVAQQVRRPEKR
jgi:ABC-type transporter Mla subunit MlaD